MARDAVEADGSLLIQAMTADLLELVAQIMQERHECEASNEVRKVVLEAERIAREKLEELRTHE